MTRRPLWPVVIVLCAGLSPLWAAGPKLDDAPPPPRLDAPAIAAPWLEAPLPAGVDPTAAVGPLVDLSDLGHVVFDVRGSRGGKGDVAASYLTASDLIDRAVTHGKPQALPAMTFVAGDAEMGILTTLAGQVVFDGRGILGGRVQVRTAASVKDLPPAGAVFKLAAGRGKYDARDELRRVDRGGPAKNGIPITGKTVVVNQTVLGNTESSSDPTILVRDQELPIATAGVGASEEGIYADPVARRLRGASRERIRRFALANLPRDTPAWRRLRHVLQGDALRGAQVTLAYGLSLSDVRRQAVAYLSGLSLLARQEGRSFVVATPSAVTERFLRLRPLLRRRIKFVEDGELPRRAQPGMVYVLRTGNLPHPVFVALMAYSALPPVVAGDGAMSAAIALGRPFAMTRIDWNEHNVDTWLGRTLARSADERTRRLLASVYSAPRLKLAMALRGLSALFESASRDVPILTDSLASSVRLGQALIDASISTDALVEGKAPRLRVELLLARARNGDARARQLAEETYRNGRGTDAFLLRARVRDAAADRYLTLRVLAAFSRGSPRLTAAVARLALSTDPSLAPWAPAED